MASPLALSFHLFKDIRGIDDLISVSSKTLVDYNGVEMWGTISEPPCWTTIYFCVTPWRPSEHNQSGNRRLDMPVLLPDLP